MRASLTVLALGLALAATASAQEAPPAAVPRQLVPLASSPIRVDGELDEPAWQGAWAGELAYEVWPGENVPAPVRTEVLATHDAEAAYFAFRAHDPDPSQIRAYLSDRDAVGGDDWVAVVLDTFNDERRAFDLMVNPLGVQQDFFETRSAEGEWDAIWEAAARLQPWGWSAEIRIPLSSLRFQRSEGTQVWGFDAVRSYPRRERHVMGLFARDRNNGCYLCQTVKIEGFQGARPGRNLEIAPTLTALRSDARSVVPGGPLEAGDPDGQVGATVRWGLTPNLTLSGTVNPDFSQVEADAVALDVNEPFALFFAEKRPFFMEGSDFFDTRLDAVYTRTVREPAWGAKLTGKEGAHTLGAYVLRDDVTNVLLPGSQSSRGRTLEGGSVASVLRYRRDLGDRFTLGALVTGREGEGYFNRMAGLDADLRLGEKDRLQLQALGSATRDPDAVADEAGLARGERRGWALDALFLHDTRTLDLWAAYRDVGRDFRADLGFVPRVDYRQAETGLGYTVNPPAGTSWFSSWNFQGYLRGADDQAGRLLYRMAVVEAQYQGPLQSHALARWTQRRDAYRGKELDGGELYLHNCMNPGRGLSFYANLTLGDQIDWAGARLGRRLRFQPGLTQKLTRRLKVDLAGTWERLDVDGSRLYTATVGQATVAYQFSTRAFLRALVQYWESEYDALRYQDGRGNEERALGSQVLFSYKVNPQTVFFLGYSDTAEGTDDFGLTKTGRTLFAKIGYAWSL